MLNSEAADNLFPIHFLLLRSCSFGVLGRLLETQRERRKRNDEKDVLAVAFQDLPKND